jgi:hypothetical protein
LIVAGDVRSSAEVYLIVNDEFGIIYVRRELGQEPVRTFALFHRDQVRF